MNRGTPEPSTHIISAFPFGVIATQILSCFQKGLLDLKARPAGPKNEHPDANESLCQKNGMGLVLRNVCSGMALEGGRGGVKRR